MRFLDDSSPWATIIFYEVKRVRRSLDLTAFLFHVV
jgi:hypothetical protein